MKNEARREQEKQAYARLVDRFSPKSELGTGILRAFLVGGAICVLGQAITDVFSRLLLFGVQAAATATSICLIFLASMLTGIGVYDKIGKYAGAGSVVPITGFSNSVTAPAMEFRREGLVLGVGAKLFTIAGPVLVYGISSSILVGLIAYMLEAVL